MSILKLSQIGLKRTTEPSNSMDLRKEYSVLQKKYNLPEYEDMDKEFELLYIVDIKEINYPLRFVRRRMSDKIVSVCNMLQSIIQPNPGSLVSLQESSAFTKEEKQEMFNLLKDLMQQERQSLVLDITFDEKADAAFVSEAFLKWTQKKSDILKIIQKIRDHWKKSEEEIKPRDRYFG